MFMMPGAKEVVTQDDVLLGHFGEDFHEIIIESPGIQASQSRSNRKQGTIRIIYICCLDAGPGL